MAQLQLEAFCLLEWIKSNREFCLKQVEKDENKEEEEMFFQVLSTSNQNENQNENELKSICDLKDGVVLLRLFEKIFPSGARMYERMCVCCEGDAGKEMENVRLLRQVILACFVDCKLIVPLPDADSITLESYGSHHILFTLVTAMFICCLQSDFAYESSRYLNARVTPEVISCLRHLVEKIELNSSSNLNASNNVEDDDDDDNNSAVAHDVSVGALLSPSRCKLRDEEDVVDVDKLNSIPELKEYISQLRKTLFVRESDMVFLVDEVENCGRDFKEMQNFTKEILEENARLKERIMDIENFYELQVDDLQQQLQRANSIAPSMLNNNNNGGVHIDVVEVKSSTSPIKSASTSSSSHYKLLLQQTLEIEESLISENKQLKAALANEKRNGMMKTADFFKDIEYLKNQLDRAEEELKMVKSSSPASSNLTLRKNHIEAASSALAAASANLNLKTITHLNLKSNEENQVDHHHVNDESIQIDAIDSIQNTMELASMTPFLQLENEKLLAKLKEKDIIVNSLSSFREKFNVLQEEYQVLVESTNNNNNNNNKTLIEAEDNTSSVEKVLLEAKLQQMSIEVDDLNQQNKKLMLQLQEASSSSSNRHPRQLTSNDYEQNNNNNNNGNQSYYGAYYGTPTSATSMNYSNRPQLHRTISSFQNGNGNQSTTSTGYEFVMSAIVNRRLSSMSGTRSTLEESADADESGFLHGLLTPRHALIAASQHLKPALATPSLNTITRQLQQNSSNSNSYVVEEKINIMMSTQKPKMNVLAAKTPLRLAYAASQPFPDTPLVKSSVSKAKKKVVIDIDNEYTNVDNLENCNPNRMVQTKDKKKINQKLLKKKTIINHIQVQHQISPIANSSTLTTTSSTDSAIVEETNQTITKVLATVEEASTNVQKMCEEWQQLLINLNSN